MFLLLLTNGCICEHEYGDADDEDLYVKPCAPVDPTVNKVFTFEIHGKYRTSGEPIQNEGSVTVGVEMDDYSLQSEMDGQCKYKLDINKSYYTEDFDTGGKAVINTVGFNFDNKYDKLYFNITVHFPHSSDVDQFANTQYGTAKYDSENNYILFFSYISEYDL